MCFLATFPSFESNEVDFNCDLLNEEVDDDCGGGLGDGGSDEDEGRLQQYFSPAGGPALKDQPTPPLQPPPQTLPPPPRLHTHFTERQLKHTLSGERVGGLKKDKSDAQRSVLILKIC